ncbi:MAG TPA: T9SS type A sorting domain-containing protein [Bacteroidota bacterium]|nr:T9SS type A sorting domain-containing protein [Bacteroidota bacterium]
MKKLTHVLIPLLLLVSASAVMAESPEGAKKKDQSLAKEAVNDQWDFISVNNCLMWMSNNGRMAHNPLSDGSGFEYPTGSAKYVVFTDGIIWGGRVQGEIRVGGATYNAGLQAGQIRGDGTASDPGDPKSRLYKIRKVLEDSYLNLDAAYQIEMKKDYEEWPVQLGAPWNDKDGNGVYEPDFADFLEFGYDSCKTDTPLLPGDETIWFVSNDLDPRRTRDLYGVAPIGIELHTLVWAYSQTGPLANMVFTKYTVINKGINDLTDAYFAKWSDPDLGDAFDDFVGIDTTLSLGFVFNGLAKDEVYGVPPAAGYDFFQGPIVPSAGDSAVWNFGRRQGYRNLPVSTFAFYINGSSVYRDPYLKDPQGSIQMYNYLTGRLWNGARYVDPSTGNQVTVCLAGDPITGDGWVDGIINSPGDRRFLMTAGPFTLAVGDTQEVVVATIVAQGADRISSLKVLKFFDKFAQLAFDNQFDLPKAPPSPKVNVALLNKRLILHWGEPAQVARIESHNDRGFKFQGYNVYQFPTESSTLEQGIRLATYDVSDGVSVIFDEIIDQKSGIVLEMPRQYGTDGGVQRIYDVTMDAITDRPLVNNQPYYFAVTAYGYNDDPEASPRQLESSPVIIEARPQLPDPGYRFGEPADDAVPVAHTSGTSAGYVEVVVVDPLRLTGDTYEVTFDPLGQVETTYDHDLDGAIDETLTVENYSAWTLRNINKGTTLVNKSQAMAGLDREFFVLDGFKIGVSGTGYYRQFNKDGFDAGDVKSNHDEILRIEWEGGPEVFEPAESNRGVGGYSWQMGYTSMAITGRPGQFGSSLKGYEVDKVVEIRWNEQRPSKGYLYVRGVGFYGYVGYFDSPIQIWDVTDPNPQNHKQLSYAFVERSNVPGNNRMYNPTASADDREMLFILDEPYSETPNPAWSSAGFSLQNGAAQMPIMYWGWYLLNSQYTGLTKAWRDGSLYRITPKVPFHGDDKYVFTTMKASYDKEVAKQDITQISVFPNPYYGSNKRERNKYQRFVTFNHLPPRAKFKVYTLSGVLVKSFEKNDQTQYATWDLQNDNALPVASGLYYIHVEMPDLGVERILKLAVITETQFLDRI